MASIAQRHFYKLKIHAQKAKLYIFQGYILTKNQCQTH